MRMAGIDQLVDVVEQLGVHIVDLPVRRKGLTVADVMADLAERLDRRDVIFHFLFPPAKPPVATRHRVHNLLMKLLAARHAWAFARRITVLRLMPHRRAISDWDKSPAARRSCASAIRSACRSSNALAPVIHHPTTSSNGNPV